MEKFYNNENVFSKIKLVNETTEKIKLMGLNEGDFEFNEVKTGDRKGNVDTSIQLIFRVKGNKKVIDYLLIQGWEIDRRYRNDDGSPSLFASDIHGKNMYFKVTMIVMKYKYI